MAKRFIDTGFLDQKWIRKLTPEQKIFLIYLMLKCDNAGIIELDIEDAEFWIGKKISNFTEHLPKDYLIPLQDSDKYFMPKFIEWQYPNFPNSKVHQQAQAIKILEKHGLINPDLSFNLPKVYLNIGEDLGNIYPHGNVNDNGNVKKGGTGGKTLMKNSGVKIEDIRKAFQESPDLKNADAYFYFNTALDWSSSKGEMRTDWIATVRNFARSDKKDGKMKIQLSNKQVKKSSNFEQIINDDARIKKPANIDEILSKYKK